MRRKNKIIKVDTWSNSLIDLREKQQVLKKGIDKKFNIDTFRKLNIINQKIIVAMEMLKSGWKKATVLPFFLNKKKSKQQHETSHDI